MRQIPSEGEYCGDCPCHEAIFCTLIITENGKSGMLPLEYRKELHRYDFKRLPVCLEDPPMIVSRKVWEDLHKTDKDKNQF